jgi:hypothetical protein
MSVSKEHTMAGSKKSKDLTPKKSGSVKGGAKKQA